MAFSNTRVILPNEAHDARDLNPVPLSELNAMTSALYNNNHTVPFSPLPMFCSHCPGWVCYAEKTHPQCLPYISRAKSAQQILGSIFKHILTQPSSIVEYAGNILIS